MVTIVGIGRVLAPTMPHNIVVGERGLVGGWGWPGSMVVGLWVTDHMHILAHGPFC